MSESSHRHPIWHLFEITAYFASNNMLDYRQTEAFLEWVLKNKYAKHLNLFLKLDLATVRSFRRSLLKEGIRGRKLEFLRSTDSLRVHFDEFGVELMGIGDPDFLDFVLRQLNTESKKGQLGGLLLRRVARTPHICIAEYLIEAGADVNIKMTDTARTTSLWEAVMNGNLEMVQHLIDAGADINASCNDSFYPRTVVGLAVSQERTEILEYLLNHGASPTVDVYGQQAIDYAALSSAKCFSLLRKKVGPSKGHTMNEIISAANIDEESLEIVISGDNGIQITDELLEECLVRSLDKAKPNTQAIVRLLQRGVDPGGSHLPFESEKPLLAAIKWGYLDHVNLLIHFKANVNIDGIVHALSSDEETNFDVIESVIKAGLDLQKYGPELLESATFYRMHEMVALLIEHGAPVNRYGLEATVFQVAALTGKLELMRYLVGRGANWEKPAYAVNGFTALQGAGHSRVMEAIQYLTDDLRADINAPPAIVGGMTALEATVRPHLGFPRADNINYENYYKDEEVADAFAFLLGKGAQVNHSDGSPSPLLHDLIERELVDLLHRVLELGAHIEHLWKTVSSSKYERTPIQLASETKQLKAVKLLLKFGAELNAPPATKYGRTALQAAASSQVPDVGLVKFLIHEGAHVNARAAPIGGLTALQAAAIQGQINIASLLIENNADVNAAASYQEGRTAIDGAAEHGRMDMVQMLLNAGAVGDVTGRSGFKNAINLAKKNRHFEIVNMLEAQEA
jgi:ankyrin repeat protein